MSSYLVKFYIIIKASLLIWASCFFIAFSYAIEKVNQEAVLNMALNQKLYKDQLWIKLLHYERTITGKLKSPIKSDDFFFSKEGSTKPKEELKATIKAFFSKKKYKNPDLHPLCRFRARRNWILKRLNLDEDIFKKQNCPKYFQWSHNNKVKSISLIFATGYLGNPASFFGHPLLKFNVSKDIDKVSLLDYSLNYGALTGDNDDPISYSVKGLFGGYNAAFTHIQFFYHNHNYSETELRDMWEYQLNLTKAEVDLIVDHAWEMLGREITYFFTQDNCAFRMAELLNLVIKEPILPEGVPYAIPHTLFDRIAHMKRNSGSPVVSKIKYIPSRQTKLTSKYNKLSDSEKRVVKSIIKKKSDFKSSSYEELSISNKISVTNTLVDYSMFLLATDKDNLDFKSMRRKYLIERSKLPIGKVEASNARIEPIHKGQRPVLTRLSLGNWKNGEAFYDFEVRPAYYDLLSPDTGRLPYSSLAIGRMELRMIDNQILIRELDFFNVSAFNLAETDLPGDGSFAWKFKLGLTSQKLNCVDCQVLGMQMGFGHAIEVSPFLVPYFFVGPNLTSSKNDFGTVGSRSDIGFIFTLNKNYRVLINQSYLKNYNQNESYLESIEVDQRFGNFRTWDIRIGYKYQETGEYKLSYSYYW